MLELLKPAIEVSSIRTRPWPVTCHIGERVRTVLTIISIHLGVGEGASLPYDHWHRQRAGLLRWYALRYFYSDIFVSRADARRVLLYIRWRRQKRVQFFHWEE